MLSINWAEVLASPVKSLKVVLLASLRTIKFVCQSLLSPSESHKALGIRNGIARAWLGTLFAVHPDVFYSEPSNHTTQTIETAKLKAYIIPQTKNSELQHADAVVIYAHGGGMIFGHPLQYLKAYKRWSTHARTIDKQLVFIPVRYRKCLQRSTLILPSNLTRSTALSVTDRWPAQRNAIVAAYQWVLEKGVSPSRVVFAGDSAGANLVMLAMLYIRDHGGAMGLPAPSCGIVISPFFDMTGVQTRNSAQQPFDFLFEYDSGYPVMNSLLRPQGSPADTPEISSLLHDNVGNLSPHLLMYSRTEVLGSDSQRWYKRARAAKVDITEFALDGELHTFPIGWPVSSVELQGKCDKLICSFIFEHVKPTPSSTV